MVLFIKSYIKDGGSKIFAIFGLDIGLKSIKGIGLLMILPLLAILGFGEDNGSNRGSNRADGSNRSETYEYVIVHDTEIAHLVMRVPRHVPLRIQSSSRSVTINNFNESRLSQPLPNSLGDL